MFQAKLGIHADECRKLITEMSTELNEHRTVNTFGILPIRFTPVTPRCCDADRQ